MYDLYLFAWTKKNSTKHLKRKVTNVFIWLTLFLLTQISDEKTVACVREVVKKFV